MLLKPLLKDAQDGGLLRFEIVVPLNKLIKVVSIQQLDFLFTHLLCDQMIEEGWPIMQMWCIPQNIDGRLVRDMEPGREVL